MPQINVNFSTNADQVQKEIQRVTRSLQEARSEHLRLQHSLNTNTASSRALTGDVRARQSILKLDSSINALAKERTKVITGGLKFQNMEQEKVVKNLVHTNEVLRIQKKMFSDNARAMVNFGKNTQWAGRQLVVGFTVPLTIAAGAAMRAFSDLEKEMIKFKRVYGDTFTTTEQTNAAAESVKKLAMEWTKYGVAVSDTIDLASQAAGAGFTGNQLTTQVTAANRLAVLGELDKQKAMKATIALQSTFKMSNSELSQSVNFLNQIENQTMVTMDDMTTAIPKAATVVQGLGGNIKDLTVFMAAMEEGGVTAAEAANALKSGLGSLLNPSKKAKEELASIGVSLEDLWAKSEKNGDGVIFVVEKLGKALNNLGQTQKQQVIEELFGKHQFARMNALLDNINTGTQAVQAKTVAGASQLESALLAQKELGKVAESNLTKMQAAAERFKAAVAPIGESLMGALNPIISFATKLVEGFEKLPDGIKKFIGVLTIGLGVVTPIVLMLAGQFANMIGNIMQFINMFRKGGKWVEASNVSIAESLGMVESRIIAENVALQQNTTLWKQRATNAATGSSTMFAGKVNAVRRATGGWIPGKGNSDSIPALLTPGEFVVNKDAAGKFGPILGQMNSGKLQGFNGGNVRAHLTNRNDFDDFLSMDVSNLSAGDQKKLTKAVDTMLSSGLHPAKYISTVSNLTRGLPSGINTALSGKGVPANTLAAAWTGKNSMGQALWSGGANRQDILSGKYAKANVAFDTLVKSKLRSMGSVAITDEVLAAIVAQSVKQVGGNYPEFAQFLTSASKQTGQVRMKNASQLGSFAQFKKISLMDVLLRTREGSRGFSGVNLMGRRSFRQWGKSQWQQFAAGGFVPGTGNKDTIPAMLTPGEAVINKKASSRFAPILEAMNAGRLKMLAAGGVDQGAEKNWEGIYPREKITQLFNLFKNHVQEIVDDFGKIAHLTEQERIQVQKTIEDNIAFNKRGQAAHVVPEVNAATGAKVYRAENTVITTALENNAMTKLGGKNNLTALQNVALKMQQQDNLAMKNGLISQKQLDASTKERIAVMQRLINGEHIIDDAERKMASNMILAAGSAGTLSDAMQRDHRAIAAVMNRGGLETVAGQRASAAVNAEQRARINTSGVTMIPGGKPGKVVTETTDNFESMNKAMPKKRDWMSLAFGMSMLTTQFTGLTDKLGGFGQALMTATNVAMISQGFGLNVGGVGGKLTNKLSGIRGFSKFSLLRGGIGGAIGGVAGSLIGNKVGGAGGSAIQWGATGAGLGAALGPLGAAIGGAVGALAGFTVSTLAANKAQKEAKKAIDNSSSAWKKSANDIAERYQLGSNSTLSDFMNGIASATDEQKELYNNLVADIRESGTFADRYSKIETLSKNQDISTIMRNEIQGIAAEFRGRGVDEESIQMIVKAFLDNAPGSLTGGLSATDKELLSTNDMIGQLNNTISKWQTTVTKEIPTTASSLRPGVGYGSAGAGALKAVTVVDTNMSLEDLASTVSLLGTATESLNTEMINLDTSTKNGKKKMAELQDQQEQLNTVWERAKAAAVSDEQRAKLNQAASQSVYDTIASGKGQGMTNEKWDALIKDFEGNSIELSQAAAALMQAGLDVQNWSPEQIQAAGAAQLANAKAQAEYDVESAAAKDAANDLQALSATVTSVNKELKDRANEIALDKEAKRLEITGAQLTISQINIETSALAAFVGKFNRAFGTAIDSFADAQYQIDAIGAKIQAIQLHTVYPLQQRIDALNRKTEMDNRKIEKLQKKQDKWEERKQKRIEKLQGELDDINKSYDAQNKALERVKEMNDYIFEQQKNAVDMSSSLAKGDVAGAITAMIASNQSTASFAGGLAQQQLADQRDVLISRKQGQIDAIEKQQSPYATQIEKIQDRIEKRTLAISKLEDKIYSVQKKQIEPLQRRADLMSEMLSNSKMEMENQKANANGLDAENFARKQALNAAKQQLQQAQDRSTVEDEIKQKLKDQMDVMNKKYKKEFTNAQELHNYIANQEANHEAAANRASAVVKQTSSDLEAIKAGSVDVIKTYNDDVEENGIAGVMLKALDYIETGDVRPWNEVLGKKTAAQKAADAAERLAQARRDRANPNNFSTGGTVGGTGGMDSVPAMLTPGEYVIRKPIVDQVGESTLRRLNQGGIGLAAGGSVPNYLGTFGKVVEDALDKAQSDSKIAKTVPKTKPKTKTPSGGGSTKYIPNGPIPGLAKKEPGPSGMAAERASWIKPTAVRMMRYVKHAFPWAKGTTYMSSGEHGSGKAVDYWPSLPYRGAGNAQGWKLARWARKWSGPLRVSNVIWDDHIWSKARSKEGWRPYQHYSGSRSDTDRHLNHVHILNYKRGGLVPGVGNIDKMPAMLTPGEFVLNRDAVKALGYPTLKRLNSAPRSTNTTPSGGAVYNYDMSFDISGVEDPNEVADLVLRRMERATRSTVGKK